VAVILAATTVKTLNPVRGACFFNYSTAHCHMEVYVALDEMRFGKRWSLPTYGVKS